MMIDPPCAVMSPMRAAHNELTNTVMDAFMMTSGGPTQTHMSVIRACGMEPVKTVTEHGGIIGPPTWGIGGTPGVTIGQTCMSPRRAAGWPMRGVFHVCGRRASGAISYQLSAISLALEVSGRRHFLRVWRRFVIGSAGV